MQPRTRFTLLYYLWVFGLLLLVDSLFFSAPPVPDIAYSEFLERVTKGGSAKVVLTPEQIYGEMKPPAAPAEGAPAGEAADGGSSGEGPSRRRTRRRRAALPEGLEPPEKRRRGGSTSRAFAPWFSGVKEKAQQQQREREEAIKRQFTVTPLDDPNLVETLQAHGVDFRAEHRVALLPRPVLQLDPAVRRDVPASGASSCSAWAAVRARSTSARARPRSTQLDPRTPGPLHRRRRRRRGGRGDARDRLLPEGAGEVHAPRRQAADRRAAGRPAGHRQDAARARGRRRGRACRSSASRARTSSRCSSASARRACATCSPRPRRRRRASSSSTSSTRSASRAASRARRWAATTSARTRSTSSWSRWTASTASRGVVLIGATNRPEVLDPALLRPGRFDRQVLVDRPDREGRLAIFRIHARGLDARRRRRPRRAWRRRRVGFVGADIANLCNEAALLAARRGATTSRRPTSRTRWSA